MPSIKIQADIFTRLFVLDSPKGSSNTFKTHKNISPYFKRRYLIIYNYFIEFIIVLVLLHKWICRNILCQSRQMVEIKDLNLNLSTDLSVFTIKIEHQNFSHFIDFIGLCHNS